jgi:hypothetical protein
MERLTDNRWLAFDYKVEGHDDLFRLSFPIPTQYWGERSVVTQLAEQAWALVNRQFPAHIINRVDLYGFEVTDPGEIAQLEHMARQHMANGPVIEVEVEQ